MPLLCGAALLAVQEFVRISYGSEPECFANRTGKMANLKISPRFPPNLEQVQEDKKAARAAQEAASKAAQAPSTHVTPSRSLKRKFGQSSLDGCLP